MNLPEPSERKSCIDDTTTKTLDTAQSLFPSPLFWSPDSNQIAFIAGLETSQELFVVNRDNSSPRQLTDDAVDKEMFTAAWSPDGKQLAYLAFSGIGNVIYTVSSDGTNLRQLTDSTITGIQGDHDDFSWLDNQRIVFTRSNGTNRSIYAISVTGHELTKLNGNGDGEGEDAGNLTVSPDRHSIAYFLYGADTTRLCIVNTDDSTNHCLDKNMENLAIIWGGKVAYAHPAWSPAGKQIAFGAWDFSKDIPPYRVYIVDTDGSNLHRLTDNNSDSMETYPVWLP